MAKTWGGRFKGGTDPEVESFSESISFDRRLAEVDIAGSRAHVKALADAKLLTPVEARTLDKNLQKVLKLAQTGKLSLDPSLEDIHTAVETTLTRLAGPVGGKLHTARSRNDQVATDLRLYLRKAVREISEAGLELVETLATIADKEKETVMPGYTHMQRAMPITLGHAMAAYGYMFSRDVDRFLSGWNRADLLPLGSGALAGMNHPIDRKLTAKLLGFRGVVENSLDAVSDRDALVDFLSACSCAQMHLSRLSEDLVIWNTAEFHYVELEDAFATGSSLMPQKKNPDVAELIRGKTGRVYGNLMGLLTLLKGLPLSYNRDLQEDKELFFDSFDTVKASLKLMSRMLKHVRFQREWMSVAAHQDPTLLATDFADVLVKQGMPFRKAHEVIGRTVSYCLLQKKRLQDLSDAELKLFSDKFPPGISEKISAKSSVLGKKAIGGPSPESVALQAKTLKQNAGLLRKRLPKG